VVDAQFGRYLPVIAKLETPQSVEVSNLEGIVDALAPTNPERRGAVMIARGDLAVRTCPEKVPGYQELIIDKAAEARVPCIVATQMLQSMISNPRPARAEAQDIATAVRQYADCVMLSDETADPRAKHAQEVVRWMAKILREAEASREPRVSVTLDPDAAHLRLRAVAQEGARLAQDLESPTIVVSTHTGKTPAMFAYYKPSCPILALTDQEETQVYLLLCGGVFPMLHEFSPPEAPDMFQRWMGVFEEALQLQNVGWATRGVAPAGGRFAVTAFGLRRGRGPTGPELETNTLRLIQPEAT